MPAADGVNRGSRVAANGVVKVTGPAQVVLEIPAALAVEVVQEHRRQARVRAVGNREREGPRRDVSLI